MIAWKTFREVRWMMVAYIIILEVTLLPTVEVWPDLYDALRRGAFAAFEDIFQNLLPGFSDGLTDPNERTAFRNYMAGEVFLKNANVAGIAAAILMGTGIIARERENQTLEFLLARPVTRSAILWNKFWVIALCVTVPIFVTSWTAIPLANRLAQGGEDTYEIPFWGLTNCAVHASAFLLFILALTTVFSAFARYQVHVAFWIGGIVVTNVSVYLIPETKNISLINLSDYTIYNPLLAENESLGGLLVGPLGILLVATISLYALADYLFRRSDL